MNVKELISEISEIYTSNSIPWVIGYSGGKDSSAVLQLVFQAIMKLPIEKRNKPIHVISNDTLVENPIVQKHIDIQLSRISSAGKKLLFAHDPKLFVVKKTTPSIKDTFWINLIANGYPAPNKWFRWCTQRMKINPTNECIESHPQLSENVILVLGTRMAESTDRAKSMTKYENQNGTKLRKHVTPGSFVYAPIADLSNDDVWTYLLQVSNFWGSKNYELLTLYKNASGECPLIIETGTASCGNSRFGCWVCTVVKRDKSMENLIENGEEWMEEMLDFRNWLVSISQQDSQKIPMVTEQKTFYGPLLLKTRKSIFNRLLELQKSLNQQLITEQEILYIEKVFKNDSMTAIDGSLFQWDIMLKNQKSVSLISDHNPLFSSRKKIGNISIDAAKMITASKIVGNTLDNYKDLTRVIYF